MSQESSHLCDQDLLLWIDGELPSRRAARVRHHLHACWTCRTRMTELERAISDFVHVYRYELEATLPPIEGPRALLKARIAARSASSSASGHAWFGIPRVYAAGTLAALLLAGIVIGISRDNNPHGNLTAVPNLNLTPGATSPVTIQDVCRAGASADDPAVPDPLKREVLKEYGLTSVSNNAYQIDYLVTPRLGGAPNIRNLWPQPSLNTVWNARVKDALEDRLHNLVCSGQLDLATAQREISQDWVAAYKKYFRTNQPLRHATS